MSHVNGCNSRWQSEPTLSETEGANNHPLAVSVFFSRIHFAKFERFCSNMNLKTISEDTYSKLRKRFVFPVIQKACSVEIASVTLQATWPNTVDTPF